MVFSHFGSLFPQYPYFWAFINFTRFECIFTAHLLDPSFSIAQAQSEFNMRKCWGRGLRTPRVGVWEEKTLDEQQDREPWIGSWRRRGSKSKSFVLEWGVLRKDSLSQAPHCMRSSSDITSLEFKTHSLQSFLISHKLHPPCLECHLDIVQPALGL